MSVLSSMAVWSSIVRPTGLNIAKNIKLIPNTLIQNAPRRVMSDHERTLNIVPSRWQWSRTKDLFHFYFLLGAIPLSLLITYVNIFIGPATLQEIPEGYTPKHYEYERHPISRFIARYIYPNPQKEYEKYMQYVHVQVELRALRNLHTFIKRSMKEHKDHQGFYYFPHSAQYAREARHLEEITAPTRST